MIALYVITNAWAATVIVTAGQLWIVGVAHGLRAALRAQPSHTTENPPDARPRHPHPRKWASDNSHAPMLLWPHGN